MTTYAQTILQADPDELAAAKQILWRYQNESITLREMMDHYTLLVALERVHDE